MKNYVGNWVSVNLAGIAGYGHRDKVHEEDWMTLVSSKYLMTLRKCIGVEGDYLCLAFGGEVIRVRYDDVEVQIGPTPEFSSAEF